MQKADRPFFSEPEQSTQYIGVVSSGKLYSWPFELNRPAFIPDEKVR